MINLEPGMAYNLKEKIQKYIIWNDFTNIIVSKNMAYQEVKLKKEYDLFIAHCADIYDLLQVPAIRGWKNHCRTSICWIDELWIKNLPKYKHWLSALKNFDHIILGLNGTVEAISNLLERPCYWIPSGVDAIRFSPFPHSPTRVIDICNIGRIWEGIHQAMIKLAAEKKLFYVYDTFHVSDTETKNYRQHREMIANMAKRSKYFFVAPAKMNLFKETDGQIEVGSRYYEASAAGAVMLGNVPDCESFRSSFNWPDAVIEINPDGSDVSEVILSLSAQPERLLEISRRNASEALLRHDWVYRWRSVLDIAGLKPTPAMEIRENKLKLIAEQI
ncbi:glycosyltransferase [bacterium]|nr:glycosyltransferase [bacterium]